MCQTDPCWGPIKPRLSEAAGGGDQMGKTTNEMEKPRSLMTNIPRTDFKVVVKIKLGTLSHSNLRTFKVSF